MSKKFLFKLFLTLSVLGVSVLWLVSMFIDIPLKGGFNIYWAIALLATACGVLYILLGFFSKSFTTYKKINILFGAGLLVVALLAIVQIYSDLNKYTIPIIAVIISSAVVLCVIAVGGKSWDEGDNQKVGYKNYYQRKAEKDKKDDQQNY